MSVDTLMGTVYQSLDGAGFKSTLGIQKVRTELPVLTSSNMLWLTLADDLRTASMGFAGHRISTVKELLATV